MFAAPNILENATMHFHFPQSINQSIKLARSKFTMAPRGDRPWSQRFFEAIMAGSIPVVQSHEHTGRGPRERGLGYKVYMQNDETKYVYREDWARHNLEVFIRHQIELSPAERLASPFERAVDQRSREEERDGDQGVRYVDVR